MAGASELTYLPISFAQELHEAQPALMALAWRFTRDPTRAQDLLHDTIERVLRYRESYKPGSRFRSWASTIMAHTFISQYRRQRREQTLLTQVTADEVVERMGSAASVDAARGALYGLCRASLSDPVIQALGALSPEYRAVVDLCDVRGLSYKAAARKLGCPMGTVMSRLYRARRLLRASLEGSGAQTAAHRLPKTARAA